MHDIRIIMSDIDGTLLTSEGRASLKTVNEIKRVKGMGILFGIATGRTLDVVEACLEQWGVAGLPDIIMGMNGIHIKDGVLGQETIEHLLEGRYIKEVIEQYKDMDVNFTVYHEGCFKVPKDDRHIRRLVEFSKWPYKVVDFDELLEGMHDKLLIICDEEYMPMVQERCDSIENENYYGMQSAPILFEFMNPDVSKSEGLKTIMSNHGLTMDNLMTFGDADNDYEMIRDSGIGVVMANGSEKTKSVADVITDDNDHDGIGNFLENYFR